MNDNLFAEDIKNLLVRVEGTINVLRKPDVVRAISKLQGMRDKLSHMLSKLNEKDINMQVVDQIRQINDGGRINDSNKD